MVVMLSCVATGVREGQCPDSMIPIHSMSNIAGEESKLQKKVRNSNNLLSVYSPQILIP